MEDVRFKVREGERGVLLFFMFSSPFCGRFFSRMSFSSERY